MRPVALIIGGTGFVGPHLARQLSDRYDVTTTGRDQDIRDPDIIQALVSRAAPQIVVNLAAITTVRESFEDPRLTYEIGFFGLLNLLLALQSNQFSGSFLYVSSSEVYGFPADHDLPLTEAAPVRPTNPYSVAKAAGELLCQQWVPESNFRIMIARPFTHIGPGQSTRFAVARFARAIAEINSGRRQPVIRVGSLQATRDLTDVRDVVRGYDLILHHGESGKVFNVCSDREVVIRDVLDELIRLSGKDIQVVTDETRVRKLEHQRLRGSNASLRAATEWSPEYVLSCTLADTLAAALERGS